MVKRGMDYKRLSKNEILAHARANARGDRSRFVGSEWVFMRVIWDYRDSFRAGDVTIAQECEDEGSQDSWWCYSPRLGEEILVHDDALRVSSKEHGPG